MKGTLKPRVKICCISSVEEAKKAIEHGASAIGLVGNMPSGPGVIDDQLIQEIALSTPPPIATFLLTSETSVEGIVTHYKKVNTNTIQIVDELKEGTYQQLREQLPKSVKIIQVIHVIDENSIQEAIEISKYVDAILLDSGNPNQKVKTLGGTGNTHDWSLSKAIREAIDIPLFLAGGLKKENIKEAIKAVQPYGIDLCSGVRINGKLDEEKLKAFFEEIRSI